MACPKPQRQAMAGPRLGLRASDTVAFSALRTASQERAMERPRLAVSSRGSPDLLDLSSPSGKPGARSVSGP